MTHFDTYDEALAAAARGVNVDPAELVQLQKREQAADEQREAETAAVQRISAARQAYVIEGEKRIDEARGKLTKLRKQLDTKRNGVADAAAALAEAENAHRAALASATETYAAMVEIASECWPGGVPRDENGNPTAAIFVHPEAQKLVIDGTIVGLLEDAPSIWQ